MKLPLVSVIIATFNSEKTLSVTLASIKRQDYPPNKIEILVIDGGSKDKTLEIARKYGCRILKNPKIDQVYAKHLGWLNSKGKYILFLDSDEVLGNRMSIRNKILTATNDQRVKTVIGSGYGSSSAGFQLNRYINEYGDPFSFFMYRISKDEKFFLRELKKKGKKIYENDKAAVFDFSNLANPPFIELTSMGVLIDRMFVKANFPEVFREVFVHTHLFYLLNSKGSLFALAKHDPVFHHPADSLTSYLKKINSRIKNNIFQTSMGQAGFMGREKYQSAWHGLKRFLFVPYNVLLLPLIIDSIYLAVARKSFIYLSHLALSLYTLFAIVFYYLVKTFAVKVKLSGYGT